MKKNEFAESLVKHLTNMGIEQSVINAQVERVLSYIDNSGMEDIDVDPADMADGIAKALASAPKSPGAEQRRPAHVSDEIVQNAARAERESDVKRYDGKSAKSECPAAKAVAQTPKNVDKFAPNRNAEDRLLAARDKKREHRSDVAAKNAKKRADGKKPRFSVPAKQNSPSPANKSNNASENARKEKSPANPVPQENEKLFKVVVCVAIPLAVIAALVAVLLYLGFWLFLALGMILAIAFLILFVSAGTVVSLVGLVYGVVQLIEKATAVGFFEIGLAVIVAAAVLFAGVLLYNFAVRLIPFAMKQLARLFKFGVYKSREAYYAAKGACERL